MFFQRGIGPADVDRMELWQAMAALGQHRHPDYWQAPSGSQGTGSGDPRASGRHTASGAPVRSSRDVIAGSADLFAARRAAARGEGPPPGPDRNADPGVGAVAALLTSL